jgi:hypothetical protein
MGTWYCGVLLYGFEITGHDDEHDEFWDDPGWKWEKSHPSSSVIFKTIEWVYDGNPHVYACPKKFFFSSEMYEELEFDMDELDKASIDAELERVAKEVGATFKQPRWHVMPHGY